MKRTTFILILTLFAGIAYSQGIKFEDQLSWAEVKAKAKKEQKYIFMDCFATWCGPCKWMNENILSKKEAGDYVNGKFISVAVQFDNTSSDNKQVQNWYRTAKEIEELYGVKAYPTYLIFSPDGKAVHRIVGGTRTIDDFIAKTSEAFNPETQYYTQIQIVSMQDSVQLHDHLAKAIEIKDNVSAAKIGDTYLLSLKNPLRKEALELLIQSVQTTNSKVFNFLLKNLPQINKVMNDDDFVDYPLAQIVLKEELDSLFEKNAVIDLQTVTKNLNKKYQELGEKLSIRVKNRFQNNVLIYEIRKPYFKIDGPVANWEKISARIETKYPGFEEKKMIANEKRLYYSIKKMWPEFESSSLVFIDCFSKTFTDDEANSVAWDIFQFAKNPVLLQRGIDLIKTVIMKSDAYAEHVDTYACLLYKAGRKDEAIDLESHVVEMSRSYSDRSIVKKESVTTLKKMRKGEIIWIDNL